MPEKPYTGILQIIQIRNVCGSQMRYHIVGVKNKSEKVSIQCLDTQEEALLRVSLNPDTLECMDQFIPDSLQNFVQLNQEQIRKYLFTVNYGTKDEKNCIV